MVAGMEGVVVVASMMLLMGGVHVGRYSGLTVLGIERVRCVTKRLWV